jgi:hypothetical protein
MLRLMMKPVKTVALSVVVVAVLIGGIVGGISPAEARDPAYVGTWAKTKALCKRPSDRLDAPTVLKARSYDQFETHCALTNVANQIFRWRAKARCSVEGSIQTDTLTMSVAGKTLTYRWGTGRAQRMVRC